jgi:hypothetical protein
MSKHIGIWYSWGDVECPIEVPENADAFNYMMKMALEEVRVSITESEDAVTIWIKEDDNGGDVVVLNYHSYNEYCYYKIFDSEEECQSFLDEYMEE